MKITKIILSLCFILSLISANSQTAKLEISNLNVLVKDQKYEGHPFNIALMVGKSSEEISIFRNDQTEIRAVYKLNQFGGVKRSNLKKTAIQLAISYSFIHSGKTVTRKVIRNFYLNDDRTFDEKESAAFTSGINNSIVKVSYTGKLPQ